MVDDKSLQLVSKKGIERISSKRRLIQQTKTQSDAVIEWIHRKCPDIDHIDYMFDSDNQNKEQLIIKGYVQSGKTSFMLCSSLKYMFGPSSMSSIIVLRNAVGDSTQINARIRDMKANIIDYLRAKNVNYEVDIIVLGDSVPSDEFDSAMTGAFPRIFVVLGNGSQLRRVNTMMKKVTNPNYALFIDEADSNDTGDNRRIDEMSLLKEGASRMFYISATILEIGLREDNSDENIYMLQDVPHYMGIEKLTHRPLEFPAESNNRKDDDPTINDPNMGSFVSMFEKLEPHQVEFLETSHPQHCLITCGTVILPQQKLFKFISDHNIAVLLYNGDGIDLYHRSLDGENVAIKSGGGRTLSSDSCKWRPGAHSFGQAISIANVLQWLKDNGGVERFPRIITISGKLAGRGISFVSDDYGKYLGSFVDNTPPKWIGWRLTSMYYVPSKNTSQPNMMQCVGRVCCVVRDNIQTFLYANDEVLVDIRKAYWSQEELVARSRQLQEGNDLKIREAMHQVKMNNMKLSKRPLTTAGVKRIRTENVVEWFEEDGGFVIDDTYEKQQGEDNGWDFKTPSMKVTPTINTDDITIGLDEWRRLTTKMFKHWSSNSSHIAEFMHNLDPEKIYTKAMMTELCVHNNIRVGDVVTDKSGKSNKYGSIIKCSSSKYILYPELVTAYKLNF